MSNDPIGFESECVSCGRRITAWYRWGVPTTIDCCRRCWARVPVAERIKIQMAIRDRQPGGVLAELADIVARSIEHFKNEQDGMDSGE
jgi:hypothetical protein